MSLGLLPTLIRHLHRPPGANPAADAELVRRYASLRDGEAFADLLRRHGPLVWGVCRRRLPNRADAEDAFQSTFLVLAKRAAAIRRPEALGCWLYGVAHRVAGRMRGRSLPGVPDDLPSAAAPVAETATVREFLAALDEELLRLPEKLRGPLVLCFLQERTQDEAARQLGVSLSTLKRRLDAGRELLQVRLSGRGVELPAALAAAGLAVPGAVVRAAADGVAAGAVSTNVLTVTEGVVRAMTYTKLKAWAAGVLMVVASAGGTGYFAATGAGQAGSPDGGRPAGADPVRTADDLDELRLTIELSEATKAVRDLEAKLKQAQADRDRLKQVAKDPNAEAIARWEVTVSLYRIDLEVARERLRKLQDQLAAARQPAADPPELRKLRQEKLKLAHDMLKLVTKRHADGQSPFPDVYEWSKRVFELEQELDPSPAARLLAAKDHFTRMRKLEDQVQTSADLLDRGTVRLYRLEAETWAKEAETRREQRLAPDGGGGAAAEVEKLRLELEKVKLQAAEERARAEQLAERVLKLNDELDEIRRGWKLPPVPPGVTRAPGVPEGFKGTVRQIDGTARDLHAGNEVWVELTPGMDAGLKQGAILTVRRISGAGGKYLGTITVARVNAKDAVGRFTPANPRKVEADDLPKPGDELVPSTSGR